MLISYKSYVSLLFPDLNNLATCGDTLDETFTIAVDCLISYLYWLQKEGETAPDASPLNKIDPAEIANESEATYDEAFVNMITVDVAEYAKTHFEKSVKKMPTIPAWLNAIALEHNINFSQVLQDALREKLHVG